MPNLAGMLKEEISRLARKEVKGAIASLKKSASVYRREIAALKRQSAALKAALAKAGKGQLNTVSTGGEESPKARFSPKSVIAQRKRLGLSAADFGKVIGVSGATIYAWEQGKTRPRKNQLLLLAQARALGKKEAMAKLGEPAKQSPKKQAAKRTGKAAKRKAKGS